MTAETIVSPTVKRDELIGAFSPYVLRMRYIPGRERTADEEKSEKEHVDELFDVIDDYIEQA
jgi:hypothetical protein